MTGNYDKIIAQYRGADLNQRLHMYLQFPVLRPDFILIDQHGLKAESTPGFRSRCFSQAARSSVLRGSVGGIAKKLFGVASA